MSTIKLFEGEITFKNPFNVPEGEACFKIFIKYLNQRPGQTGAQYEGAIAVPVSVAEYHPDPLEGAATQAYLWAKEHDGLTAAMMAFCAFYYYDADAQGWVYFL
jgi:hypothetical protein